MFATPSAALSTATGFGQRALVGARRLAVTVTLEAAPAVVAPAAAPRRLADTLRALLGDDERIAVPAPALAAARGFAAGTGFVPGQLVDRAI